jgi:tRNA U34 5-carboxymethylaminomethyl modifying GTPase MnmE/TrmE
MSVFIHAGPLRAEVIDTAGLGQDAVRDGVDKEAQRRTLELVSQCDCVLWIVDCTNPSKLDILLPPGVVVIEVWNKSDLLSSKSSEEKSGVVRISAKTGDGIENFLGEIQRRLQVCDFDCALPTAFTIRQEKLLTAILETKEKLQLRQLLAEMIGG